MQNILNQLRPTREEQRLVQRIFKTYTKTLRIPKTKIILGGSSAKGTWLRNNHDIDIYILFDKKYYQGRDIAEILKQHVPNAMVLHGSRDYLQVKENDYTVELIPILAIKKVEDAQNITDISPSHTRWVRKHQKYRNDILLAKAFAKANKLYGAESFIKGFSGYALEVLTIHYKGFNKLLKNVSKWKKRTIIDTESHHKKKVVLNPAKMLSPIILIDPVQATRNVTAVVSEEKYNLFIQKAKQYQKHPKKDFFFQKEFSIDDLIKKNKGTLIFIEAIPFEGKRDVVGAKICKGFEFLKKTLESNDFSIMEADWHWNEKALLWFILKNKPISDTIKHYGPPLSEKERLKHFQEKWKGYPLKKETEKCYILKKRPYVSPEQLIETLLQEEACQKYFSIILNHKVYKETSSAHKTRK